MVTSLWVAAYLHTEHIPLRRVLPRDENHPVTAFEFDDYDMVATAARNDWWTGRAQVPSQKYLAARHELLRLKAQAEETGQTLKIEK
jgi:D5 N terminal like